MDLVPYMYFERQEAGSQLSLLVRPRSCYEARVFSSDADQARNNLLQQFTYTEFDLADIAHRLDQAENAALSAANQNKKSYNLDDTGFFSISVLERALQVWDLTLVRWRGEAMRPYQDEPEQQTGFILHLSQHWFPLRRFAPNPPHKGAIKRWYNLNSFLPQPEWISPTYLKMVLTQAEQEGYSVFVVRRTGTGKGQGGEGMDLTEGQGWGDGGVGVMPECLADTMAVELGEPVGRGGQAPSQVQTTSANMDAPSVDPTSSSPATPPAGPSRRPKRQEDLLADDMSDVDSPPRPAVRSSRSNRQQRADPMLDQDGDSLGADQEELGANEAHHARAALSPTDFAFQSRSYDDEDAALQAALKASMEDVPAGWVAPEFKRPARNERPSQAQASPAASAEQPDPKLQAAFPMAKKPEAVPAQAPRAPTATATGSRFVEGLEEDDDDADDAANKAEVLSPEEIRRRRLAKFGA